MDEVSLDQGKLAKLERDLGRLPAGLKRTLRPELKKAARPAVADAQRNASWSSRIPGAIRIMSRLSGRDTGLFIRVDAKKAPHARPYENLGQQGTFEHPTFGSWRGKRKVTQKARPFLFPAARKNRPGVIRAAGDAVDSAARQHGFH